MGRYIGIPLLLLAALLNATVMAQLRVGGGGPDLVFLLVVSWALLADVREAMLWALVGGVAQDLFSVAPVGASSFGLLIVAFGVNSLLGEVSRRNLLIPPVVAAVGTVAYHLILIAVLRLEDFSVPLGQAFAYVTLPALVYNALLAVPVFRLMGTVYYWLTPRRARVE